MKKHAAFALLATAAMAASAQSSVTLFGVLDANVRSVKNGDNTVKSLSNNGLASSRLGVRGSESLGGGLSASFWLEHGFNSDTGSQSDAARFWNRRSTVSLNGGFGELRLGRDFTPTYSNFSAYDVFGDNGVAASGKFNSVLGTGADTSTRADNLASYILPSLGGVYGQVSVAAGEGTAGKKYAGGRLGYNAGPLNVSVAYGQTDVTALVPGDDSFKSFSVGGSYNFNVVKVSAFYLQNKYAANKLTNYSVGATVPVGAGEFRLGYLKANAEGRTAGGVNVGSNDATQLALGYNHNLSKRTALYGTLARVNNKNAAAFVVAGSPALSSPNTGKDSTGYEVGIRHAF